MIVHFRYFCIALLAPILIGCASAPPPPDPDAYPLETWTTTHRPQGALMWKSSRFNRVTLRPDADVVLADFDPNTCTLDIFGDAGVCTMMAGPTLNMEATLIDKRQTRDGSTERLYELTAPDGPRLSVMFSTAPDELSPSFAKLISTSEDGGIDALINLDRVTPGPPLEAKPEPTGVISQRWNTGYRPQRALFSERQTNSARLIPDGPGRCRFILDPNSCTVDAFGSVTACTRMSTQLVLTSYTVTDTRSLGDGSVQERFEFQPDLGAIIPVAMVRTIHADGRITAKLLFHTGDHVDAVVQLLPGRGDK